MQPFYNSGIVKYLIAYLVNLILVCYFAQKKKTFNLILFVVRILWVVEILGGNFLML